MSKHEAFLGLSKSYLGGGVFKPVRALTKDERHTVLTGGRYAMDNGRPRTVYHGTSSENVPSIKAHGLRPTKDGSHGPGVYLATKKSVADAYGNLARSRQGGDAQTLKVRTEGRPKEAGARGGYLVFRPKQIKDIS